MAKQSSRFSKGRVGLERVIELLEERPTVMDSAGARVAPRLTGSIAFEDVSFGSLLVCHKLAHVEPADLILAFDSGRVVEAGTHAELLRAGGRYAQLRAASQAGLLADVSPPDSIASSC